MLSVARETLSGKTFGGIAYAGETPDRRRLCRTFSDRAAAPRQGLVSGCDPLDPFYEALPEQKDMTENRAQLRGKGAK